MARSAASPRQPMHLLELPTRLLLAAIFGFALPLLCCCGEAFAQDQAPAGTEAVLVQQTSDPHACCEAAGTEPSNSAKDQTDPAHYAPADPADCDCDTHLRAMQDVKTLAHHLAPMPQTSTCCFVLAPLPRPLLAVLADAVTVVPPPTAAEAVAVPRAPTLRTLSVLLLT